METSIAEKFHAMVELGNLNSRMKDFYDVWVLSKEFDFEKAKLRRAIQETFRTRETEVPSDLNLVFEPLLKDPNKEKQWNAFKETKNLDGLPSFETVIKDIVKFLSSVLM